MHPPGHGAGAFDGGGFVAPTTPAGRLGLPDPEGGWFTPQSGEDPTEHRDYTAATNLSRQWTVERAEGRQRRSPGSQIRTQRSKDLAGMLDCAGTLHASGAGDEGAGRTYIHLLLKTVQRLKAEVKREKRARVTAERHLVRLETANDRAQEQKGTWRRKCDMWRKRHARFMERDHIVLGGRAMSLRLVPKRNGSTESNERDEYSTVLMDNEGNDCVSDETAAPAKQPSRGKVICHEWLVSIFKGSAQVGETGGWRYTCNALMLQYLVEASLGHGSSAKEAKRLETDMVRRQVAAGLAFDGKGTRHIDSNTRTHMRPSYRVMAKKAYHAFDFIQSLANSEVALGPNVLSINFSFDGTQLRQFHMMGGAIVTMTLLKTGQDAFGNPHLSLSAHRSSLVPVQCANKIGKRLRKKNGDGLFLQETARAMTQSIMLSGQVPGFAAGNVYWSLDGAYENSGGNRDNMLAPNSAAYCLLVTLETWEEVHGSLKASGVGDFLQRFLAQGNMTELIADVKAVVRKEEESRRQARRQAKAAKEAGALSAVQPPAAQPAASSGSDEAADSTADGTANHDAAAQSPSNDSCPDPQPGSLPEACTAADAAETPPASQLHGHGDGASPHVEEWVQPPDRGDDAMSELFSESESEKSAQSSDDDSSDSEQSDCDMGDGSDRAQLAASESPHLLPPPKRRDPPCQLDTRGPVPPPRHCMCNKPSPLRPCHDNCECTARYIMGKGYDFFKNPEEYQHFDLGSGNPDDHIRAQIVKCRCSCVVRDLSKKRHTFLLWNCLRGNRLRELGIWSEVKNNGAPCVVSEKARAEHAAAVAAAEQDSYALRMIPLPEDFEEWVSVREAALNTSKLSCSPSKLDKEYLLLSRQSDKHYHTSHTRRREARLFLLRIGSVLYAQYKERTVLLLGKRFQMEVNPLRFLPCMDTMPEESDQLWRQINAVDQCRFHRIHNAVKMSFNAFDQGFNASLISVAKWQKCPYYYGPLQTAVNLFFRIATLAELELLDAETDYYKEVHAAIEQQHRDGNGMSIKEILSSSGLDPEVGLTEFGTVCELRWGSVPHASGEMFPVSQVILLGLLRRFTLGTLEAKVKAACAIVSFRGFVPSEHPALKPEAHAQRVWAFFNRTQDLLQMSVMRFVDQTVVQVFLKYASDDCDTGTLAMMGLNGVVRNVLRVLSRDIWVKVHGSRPRPTKLQNGPVVNEWIANGAGWGRKMASPFRTNGSEFAGQSSLRLLNPHCGSRVKRTLDFAADEQTINATRDLAQALVTLAKREGPALPGDISKALGSACRHRRAQYADTSNLKSFPVKMSQMQEFVHLVSLDVREAILTQMAREMYSLRGMIAGITETQKSSFFRYAGQAASKQCILKASCMAMANAVAVKIGIRDIKASMKPQLKGKDISDFLPTWGKAVSEEGLKEMEEFFGGQNVNRASDLPAIEGCLPGDNVVDGQRIFPRPVQCWARLCEASWIARSVMGSSKPAESNFSTPAAMSRTKGRATFPTIVHYSRRNFWTHEKNLPILARVQANEDIFWAASWIGRLGGWRKVFNKDHVTADVMHENFVQQDPKQMPAYIKQGKGWKQTGFVAESRTTKFSTPKPGSEEEHRLNRLISIIAARLDAQGGARADIPRDVLRDTPAKKAVDLQKIARRVRKRMNTGQVVAAGPVSKATVSAPRDTLRRQVSAGRGRALQRAPQIRQGSAGAGRGGRACHGAEQETTVRSHKRRRGRTCSGADGESDTEDECDGDSAWSPGQVLRKESGSAPSRATRARAAALKVAAGAAAARQSACDTSSSDSAVASSDSALAPAEPAAATAAAAAAAAAGDDCMPANSAPLADIRMACNAAGSLSDDEDNVSILEAARARAGAALSKDDDGIPIFAARLAAAGKEICGAKRRRQDGSDGSKDESDKSEDESDDDESEDESEEDIPQILKVAGRVWSYDFVMALHNLYYDESKEDNSAWNLSKVVIDKDSKAISVTRTAKYKPKQMKGDPSITFHVEVDDEKHFHIMFDNFAGAMLVTVTGLSKSLPKLLTDKAWSNTVKFRRVYNSAEAKNRTDARRDKIRKNHTYLGEESLQKYANQTDDADPSSATYHIGDCEYKGDIRRLIGIVRKFPEGQRFNQTFGVSMYPGTDQVFVGPHFSEKSS